MNKFITIILLGSLVTLISGCNVIKDGFESPKKNSGDEFLIEKKSPLIMPPDYNELPIPTNGNDPIDNNKSVIKDLIIKSKKNEINSSELSKNNQNLENSVLEKIKKD